MKRFACLSVALAALAGAIAVNAEEVKSGLQVDQRIGPFSVVKVGGAESDGVACGDELCYRCKYSSNPMVMVFARTTDDKLAALVAELDATVGKNADKKLKAFVNVLAESRETAEANAKAFASKVKTPNVPVVVPVEFDNGPGDYGINPKADVTVIIASAGKVVASHGYAAGALDKDSVAALVSEVTKAVQ